jgi:hypothetical protein
MVAPLAAAASAWLPNPPRWSNAWPAWPRRSAGGAAEDVVMIAENKMIERRASEFLMA